MSSGVLAAAVRGKPIGIRVRRAVWRVIVYLLLLILMAVALLWMVSTSLKPGFLEAYSLSLLPSKVTWSNYPDTWTSTRTPSCCACSASGATSRATCGRSCTR